MCLDRFNPRSVAVEENVEGYHHDDEGYPGNLHTVVTVGFRHLHWCAFILSLAKKTDGNHREDKHHENQERQHHEMHRLRHLRDNP